MSKAFLLVLCVFFAVFGSAQTKKGHLHLKNGSVLKGRIQQTDDNVKLESAGNLWIFRWEEVDTIITKSSKETDVRQYTSSSNLFYRLELGVLAGNSDNKQSAPFSTNLSINYSFINAFSVGVGLGVDFLNESYMPATLNFEYKLREGGSTPYAFLRAGYEIPLESSNAIYYDIYPIWMSYRPWPWYGGTEELGAKGGAIINPGLGYQFMFRNGFGVNVAIGYQFHRLNYKGENEYKLDIDYNRLALKVGIQFN